MGVELTSVGFAHLKHLANNIEHLVDECSHRRYLFGVLIAGQKLLEHSRNIFELLGPQP